MAVIDSRVRYGSLTVGGEIFSCQPTSAAIEPSNDTAGGDDSVEVLCGDTLSGASSATLTANLVLTAIQDFTAEAGMPSLVGHSWEFNSVTQDFRWNPTADPQDEWVGKVTVQAINVGGEVNTRLTSDVSWPITELTMPTRLGGKKVIGGQVAATGAIAGTPGTFTPSGAAAPANLGAMTAVVANPTSAWTTGQYVATADSVHQHWSGTAWATGDAALVAEDE